MRGNLGVAMSGYGEPPQYPQHPLPPRPVLPVEEEPVQPVEEMHGVTDAPAGSPNFVGGDVEMVMSPNFEWLAAAFKTNKANEALASLGFMRKSFPDCRQDELVEIKRERERQRRLLDLRFE